MDEYLRTKQAQTALDAAQKNHRDGQMEAAALCTGAAQVHATLAVAYELEQLRVQLANPDAPTLVTKD